MSKWNILDNDSVTAKAVNGFKTKLERKRAKKLGLFLGCLMDLEAVTGFQSCHPASILQGLWVSCSHVCTDKDKSHDIHFYWHCCKLTYRNLLYKYKVLHRGLTTPAFTGESSAMIFVFAQLYYLTIVTRHVTV